MTNIQGLPYNIFRHSAALFGIAANTQPIFARRPFLIMSSSYKAPPYTNDVLPFPTKEKWLHTVRWRYVEDTFKEVCRRYGYREIRTPILEQTELFTRSIGKETDIVSK